MVWGPFIWLLLTEPLDLKGATFLTDSHFWNDLSKWKTLRARTHPKLQDIGFLDWDRRVIIGFNLRAIKYPFPSIFTLAGKRDWYGMKVIEEMQSQNWKIGSDSLLMYAFISLFLICLAVPQIYSLELFFVQLHNP